MRTTRLRCLKCDAITIAERPTKRSVLPKTESSKEPRPAPEDYSENQEIAPPARPMENGSGESVAQPPRKRARGKKSTLQSMLSEQQAAKPPAETGFGLGLMDFMKT